jgi:hypothetical protein
MPAAAAALMASERNGSVPRRTVGRPRRSSCVVSWRLHDVHDPQSAEPVRKTSAPAAMAS